MVEFWYVTIEEWVECTLCTSVCSCKGDVTLAAYHVYSVHAIILGAAC